jgi:hypothetical protein
MYQGQVNTPCAVQVLEVKRLSASSTAGSAAAAERFRLSISDGIHFMQTMVATQLNPRVSSEEIKKDTVIQLEDCICNMVQGRRILIILKVEILSQPGHQIGSPVNIEDTALSAAPTAAAQVASAQCDEMSCKQLRAELQRLGIDTRVSMTKQDLQQLFKIAMELHHVKSSSKQPSEAAAAGGGGVTIDADAFICPLCTDEYSPVETVKTPRVLDCGHSFCLSCLCKSRGEFRDASSSSPLSQGIKCPACRRFTPAPTSDTVRNLPKNFTAISMMQSMKRHCSEAKSTAAKRSRTDDTQALAHAAYMCKVSSQAPVIQPSTHDTHERF